MSAVLAPEAIPARAPEAPMILRARALIQRVLLFPLVRLFCRPLVVRGDVPDGPVVFAVNHASHADTPVLLRALPPRARRITKPAAAADYFFGGRVRGFLTRLAIGAFPFPRAGRTGLDRAEAVLASGGNVVLFPEGTRSTDGRISTFKPGVGMLAANGWTVVPVALSGTGEVLPKGGRFPRRASVVVTFGRPLRLAGADARGATKRIERAVRVAAARDRLTRPIATTLYERVRAFAGGRGALALVFCWAVAEAIAFPIVPDLAVAALVLAAPRRALLFVIAALAGSVVGGSVSYVLGVVAGPTLATSMPLVTDRMAEAAHGWLATEGAAGLAHQPLSGVPFKAFALQANATGVSLDAFAGATAVARGARFAAVAAALVPVGIVFGLARGRLFALLLFVGAAGFASGLARVVGAWS